MLCSPATAGDKAVYWPNQFNEFDEVTMDRSAESANFVVFWGTLAGLTAVTAFTNWQARSHLIKGVELYNTNRGDDAEPQSIFSAQRLGRLVPNTVVRGATAKSVGIGWSLSDPFRR